MKLSHNYENVKNVYPDFFSLGKITHSFMAWSPRDEAETDFFFCKKKKLVNILYKIRFKTRTLDRTAIYYTVKIECRYMCTWCNFCFYYTRKKIAHLGSVQNWRFFSNAIGEF